MKTILLVLALVVSGCMADWTDLPINGVDVAVGADASGQGTDVISGNAGKDASTQVTCNTPTKDRLVEILTSGMKKMYHDKLLDIDCEGHDANKNGIAGFERCLPYNDAVDGLKSADGSNPRFPASEPRRINQPWPFSDNACQNAIFRVQDSLMDGAKPRYGWIVSVEGVVVNALNLTDLPEDRITNLNLHNEPTGTKNLWFWDPSKSPACYPMPEYENQGKNNPPWKGYVMFSNGDASKEGCPQRGIDIFATLPL